MRKTLFSGITLVVFMVVGVFAGGDALAQRSPNHHEPGEGLIATSR